MNEREMETPEEIPPELGPAFEAQSRAAMPGGLVDRMEKRIAADLKPVRPLAPDGYFLAILGLTFALVVAFALYRNHVYSPDVMSWLQMSAMYPALVACATLLALSLVRQMAPGSRQWIAPTLLPLSVALLLIAIAVLCFPVQNEKDFMGWGMSCLKTGATYAAPSALLFWFPLRRGAMLSPRLAGATAGMLAGLVGTSVLELHCPNTNALHILFFHLAHTVGGAAIGYVLGILSESARRE